MIATVLINKKSIDLRKEIFTLKQLDLYIKCDFHNKTQENTQLIEMSSKSGQYSSVGKCVKISE